MNKALSQYITLPIGSLNFETNLPTYATIINRNCLKAQEKELRMPSDHPRNIAISAEVPHRTVRQSCRQLAKTLTPNLK